MPKTTNCASGSQRSCWRGGAQRRSPTSCATSSPAQPSRWLCAETIYQAVYRPDLGGLPRELPGRVLRRRRRQRLPRRHAQARRFGPIVGMTLIDQRPIGVLERAQPGHWEGDLIMGTGNASAIVRWLSAPAGSPCWDISPTPSTTWRPVRDTVVASLSALPVHLRRTLTWDHGKETARHADITAALETTQVFFCDPHSPCQRPSNEHTNGVLRDYFPKGTDLSIHTSEDLAFVQAEVNRRPRLVLGWDTAESRRKLRKGACGNRTEVPSSAAKPLVSE
jgi:transposase, IS30 family